MFLLIDAGNTRIKLGWVRPETGEREAAPVALALDDGKGLAEFLGRLPAKPSKVLGVNVAGERVVQALTQALDSVFGTVGTVQWLASTEQALGVHNAYRPVGQLGTDRWMAMVGLAHRERLAGAALAGNRGCAVLATFGTATTVDTLRQESEGPRATFTFLGGLIFPGPELMRVSLAQGTANLPQAQGEAALYPTHTHQAIVTGIAAAQAGAVMRQWQAGLDTDRRPPTLYVGGGGWPAVKDELERLYAATRQHMGLEPAPVHWLAAPVLDGLACFARPLLL